MAGTSHIEWTEATWNPIAGCTILSPGCTNCYAQRIASRLQAMGHSKYRDTTRKSGRRHVWTGRVNIDHEALDAPLRWRKPLLVFVNSMSDLFQDGVDVQIISAIWKVMKEADWHTYQILTKRPKRMLDIVSKFDQKLPNVWLGISVENSAYVGRIDILRSVPAHIRFVSFEPLLGPVAPVNLQGIHWAIVGGGAVPEQERSIASGSRRSKLPAVIRAWHSSSSNGAALARAGPDDCSTGAPGTNTRPSPVPPRDARRRRKHLIIAAYAARRMG